MPPEHKPKIDAGMEQISDELVQVESELRALIGALEHGAIKTLPLVEAIEPEIREFERRSVAKVTFTCDGNARTETDSQRIALQSVTRAALANVAKHAAATTVTIRLDGATTADARDRRRRPRLPRRPSRSGAGSASPA